MVRQYETVVVVDAMIPDESIASEFEAVQKLIETQGKIHRVDRWGKRKMAYSIRKRTHAEYAAFYYESEGGLSAEIDRRLRINENVLRWLTIADNPVGIPPAPDSEEAQAAAAEQELRESRDREESGDRGERGNRGERRSRRGED